MANLAEQIAALLPNGLGARGDEERNPLTYPSRSLHVLLATSGSVASIKAPLIVRELLKHEQVDVQLVATKASLHFFDWKALEEEHAGRVKVWTDAEEWKGWSKIGDPILHIELRRWADIVLVAPCSANTLAKITQGICDNILTSLLRALPTFVPVLLFPAMNTHMYSHPLTAKQLKSATEEIGYEVHGPIAKTLACGDVGLGAMTEWSEIVKLVVDKYGLKANMSDSIGVEGSMSPRVDVLNVQPLRTTGDAGDEDRHPRRHHDQDRVAFGQLRGILKMLQTDFGGDRQTGS